MTNRGSAVRGAQSFRPPMPPIERTSSRAPVADAPTRSVPGPAAGDGVFVARLDAILSRTMGLRPGVRSPAVILDAARAAAFELDVPFDDLPERAVGSEHVRQALVAHLRPEVGRLLDPAVSFHAVVEFVAGRLAGSHRAQHTLDELRRQRQVVIVLSRGELKKRCARVIVGD